MKSPIHKRDVKYNYYRLYIYIHRIIEYICKNQYVYIYLNIYLCIYIHTFTHSAEYLKGIVTFILYNRNV